MKQSRIVMISIVLSLFLSALTFAQTSAPSNLQTVRFRTSGLDPLGSTKLEGTLKKIIGVWDAVVDWKPGNIMVQYDPQRTGEDAIQAAITGSGRIAIPANQEILEPEKPVSN